MKNLTLLICMFFLFASAATEAADSTEANDVYASLREHLNQTRSSDVVSVFVSLEQLKNADPNRVLSVLAEYENDAHLGVRHRVYYYEYGVATVHPLPEVRRKVTGRFVRTLVDPNDKMMDRKVTHFLLSFGSEDFNDLTREMLYSALLQKNVGREIILVCGVANVQEALARLKSLMIDELVYQAEAARTGNTNWYFTTGWAARLARARMGVNKDIEKCVQLADSVLRPNGYFENRVHVPDTRLLDDVSYISQPTTIRYLQGYLQSDKKLWGPHGEPWEPVASYVLDLLLNRLKGFPIKPKRGRFYSQEEIKQASQWMKKQKQWNIIR